MKFPIAVLMLSGSLAWANSGSYQSYLGQQTVTTISPVQYEGLPVVARTKEGLMDAGMICSSLGFHRTVSAAVELKQFQLGDQVAFTIGAEAAAPAMKVETIGKRQMRVLTSVECAR